MCVCVSLSLSLLCLSLLLSRIRDRWGNRLSGVHNLELYLNEIRSGIHRKSQSLSYGHPYWLRHQKGTRHAYLSEDDLSST